MNKKTKEKDKKIHNEEECNCNCNCNCDENCNCNCDENCNNEECLNECGCCQSDTSKDEKIKALEEEVLKAKAEVINYKRRKDEETARLIKYAEEPIASEFLDILDNFERAINMDDDNLDDEVSKFLEGIKMIYGHTKNLLAKHEIVEMNCLGEKFDPTYHQAVLVGNVEDKEQGIILEVLQKGYMYKDKVLRPAMVKVNE